MSNSPFLQEVGKRRTFAIISHPDAAQPFNA
jgi:peptide chain release factor 3